MAFEVKKLSIPDVILIKPQIIRDERGFFCEIYKASDFTQFGVTGEFAQVNQSKSKKNVLRGLHYQTQPKAQGKLVRVIMGEIFDVAVDIRKGSPTFGKWVGEILSAENKKILYIPIGFAHGFCALSDMTEIVYYCTNEYAPQFDRGMIWNDSVLHIDWPIKNPILSKKDAKFPKFSDIENNFIYYEK